MLQLTDYSRCIDVVDAFAAVTVIAACYGLNFFIFFVGLLPSFGPILQKSKNQTYHDTYRKTNRHIRTQYNREYYGCAHCERKDVRKVWIFADMVFSQR